VDHERGLGDLTLQDQQLVAQRQDLDVLVAVAHRQKAQGRQGAGRGDTDDHTAPGERV
jgi:hypothetical protein